MKGFKIRLTLNNAQRTLCHKHAGVARHAYNWGLSICQEAFKAKQPRPSPQDLHKRLNAEVKTKLPWYYEVSKCAPQQALRNLNEAYVKFHKLQKPSGYKLVKVRFIKGARVTKLKGLPRFKKKSARTDRFYLDGKIRANGKRIKLPHLGWLRLTEAIPDGLTITREADQWYVSFLPRGGKETEPIPAPENSSVGVDLGIKTLATLSTGVCVPAIRPYKRYKRKLKLAQRRASKKYRKQIEGKKRVKQSANYKKAQAKVARIHARIAHIRLDATHKLTTYLAKNHSRVVIEDLNIRGMSKNHRLASAILDGGMYEFRRQITYKVRDRRGELVVADRFFPSSKLCSGCGHKKDKLSLSERTYRCEKCGIVKDRDKNAADNLVQYTTASYAGVACGAANNRLDASGRAARRQEATANGQPVGRTP